MAPSGSPPPNRARERLLSHVDTMRGAERARPEDPPGGSNPSDQFTAIAAFDDVRTQRQLAERFHIANPYFHIHEGHNAAHTQIGNRAFINFSSYDYLGLNEDPRIAEAAKSAIDRYGVSASASRAVAGERPVHRALEQALAKHYGVADSLVFVSGYATNVSVIGQLAGPKDIVVCDAAIHNSAAMGSLLSGAARRTFAHNDLGNLEAILADSRGDYERALIVVEGLYSMDGDYPDLPRLIDIKRRYDAWLMIDEAHALGVMGERGYGIFEHFSVDPTAVDIWMGTLSKTLSACGGYVAGSAGLVDCLKSIAGAFVYSVAMPPAIAAAALTALEIMHEEPQRVAALKRNSRLFHDLARQHGLDTGTGAGLAICPIIVGDSLPTAVLSQQLYSRGLNVQPVLYPAVPPKTSRLRFFLTSTHTEEDIAACVSALADEMRKLDQTLAALNIPGYGR